MNKEQIIELLRKDMAGEQQAIIQYLFHAYAMPEGAIPAEIEAVAREEMYHLDWLADAIVELGGDPNMSRDPVDFSAASPDQQMLKNVDLEQVAIDQYREHIDLIEDEALRRLLSRILHDELVHQDKFRSLAAEAAAEQESDAGAGEPPRVSERVAAILNQGIRHEYSVVLQYLFHSFVAEDKEVAEQLQNAAINEMQHMGWLSEKLASLGGDPDMNHGELFLSHDTEANLEADIAIEQEVSRDYTSQISELGNPGLERLLERIRDHEIYHDAQFKDLLKEVRQEAAPAETEPKETPTEPPEKPCVPSVGSLLDIK